MGKCFSKISSSHLCVCAFSCSSREKDSVSEATVGVVHHDPKAFMRNYCFSTTNAAFVDFDCPPAVSAAAESVSQKNDQRQPSGCFILISSPTHNPPQALEEFHSSNDFHSPLTNGSSEYHSAECSPDLQELGALSVSLEKSSFQQQADCLICKSLNCNCCEGATDHKIMTESIPCAVVDVSQILDLQEATQPMNSSMKQSEMCEECRDVKAEANGLVIRQSARISDKMSPTRTLIFGNSIHFASSPTALKTAAFEPRTRSTESFRSPGRRINATQIKSKNFRWNQDQETSQRLQMNTKR